MKYIKTLIQEKVNTIIVPVINDNYKVIGLEKVPIKDTLSSTQTSGIQIVITPTIDIFNNKVIGLGNNYAAREYTTGLQITTGKTKKEALSKIYKIAQNSKFQLFVDSLIKKLKLKSINK